jgi:protein-tyrosine phosphatase
MGGWTRRNDLGLAVIDLHSHILPGLDDGARTLDDALDIARSAVADGTEVIAATPHVREDYPTTADAMENGIAALRRALEREDVELTVLPGGEVSLEQLDRLGRDELRRFSLAGNPSYLLLETPYYDWPLSFGEIVFHLSAAGITPVIAHPERNAAVQQNIERLGELVRAGALVQVTAASLDGRLGSRTRACARKLIDAELVHLLGSDAHSPGLREAGLSRARAVVGDERLARWLTEDVPAAIVEDEPLPQRPRRRKRRGVLARLLGR